MWANVSADPTTGTFFPKPEPVKEKTMAPLTPPASYKNVTFEGSTFPYDPYKIVPVTLNSTIKNEYLPALDRAFPRANKGLKYLLTAMCHAEGFKPGTRSYRYKNPGNISNTDDGKNKGFKTLEDGIRAQAEHIIKIIDGKSKSYPLGKSVHLKAAFSQEIQNNLKNYQAKDGWIPGYKFLFTGQLDQFIKIYSTGARVTNSYLNVIVSYFKSQGLTITPESKLQDIVVMG